MKNKLKNSLKSKFLGQYTGTSNREKSILILIIGFTIILALLITIRINYNNNLNNNTNKVEENNSVEFLSLDKIFNNYLDNYKYNITIDDNEIKIQYKGTINNKINNGIKTINNEETNYNIANDVIIDLKTNKEINDLYGNYLSHFFNPTNIYEFISDKEKMEEIVDSKKVYTYNSIYNDADIMFRIVTSKDRIEDIRYKYNNVEYSIKLN